MTARRRKCPPRAAAHTGAGFSPILSTPSVWPFFGSVFSLFIPMDAPLWIKAGAVGTVAAIGFVSYGTVALVFSAPVVQARYLAMGPGIERACGTVMFCFGAALFLGRA